MKDRSKLLILLVFLVGSLSTVWGHFALPTITEVRTFKSMDALQKAITKELNKYPGEESPLQIKYQKTASQRMIVKTSWQSTDYAISDFALSLQTMMAQYEFNVHGRVNLIDNEWNLHISHQNTILYTIQIAANGTK